MTTATKPREIQLPCCDICGRVGRIPLSSWGGKSVCMGGKGEIHKRRVMQPRTFREIEEAT